VFDVGVFLVGFGVVWWGGGLWLVVGFGFVGCGWGGGGVL